MKIKPSTLYLVLAALILGGIALVVEQQTPPQQTQEAQQQQNIFSFQEKQVQSLTLQTQLRSLKFERDKDGKWQMLEPDKTAASDPSIAFLLDLLAAGKSNRAFTAPVSEREQFGFHQPLATIEVKLDNQQTHKLVLGGYDFNRTFIYAQADPPAGAETMQVLVVSPNFENAVNRPLAEWKSVPEEKATPATPKATPTPEGKSEATPKATPEGSSKLKEQTNLQPPEAEPLPTAQEQASPEPVEPSPSPSAGASNL